DPRLQLRGMIDLRAHVLAAAERLSRRESGRDDAIHRSSGGKAQRIPSGEREPSELLGEFDVGVVVLELHLRQISRAYLPVRADLAVHPDVESPRRTRAREIRGGELRARRDAELSEVEPLARGNGREIDRLPKLHGGDAEHGTAADGPSGRDAIGEVRLDVVAGE